MGVCRLYTCDAADEEDSVDGGGGRISEEKRKDEGTVSSNGRCGR